jgi:hypothetical protein
VFHDSLGRSPISANLRSLGLYTEDLSLRDSVKVVQYEVLGNDAKRQVRPGTDSSLETLTQSAAAGTGLLS